ncbi:MAG: hypothetical protein GX280_01700 [Lentisphaerae bacterium]|nr:hypothetical protein [Lentisphaerota bacterium]
MNNTSILIGNSFPLSLARRKLIIEPASLDALLTAAAGKRICSFWGHENTLAAASAATKLDLAPAVERPVMSLSPDKLPMLGEYEFSECWIVSSDYRGNFRPSVGAEVPESMISGWQVLKLTWE